MLVVRYGKGQFFEPHLDYFSTSPPAQGSQQVEVPMKDALYRPPKGSNRFVTILIFLTDGSDECAPWMKRP